MNKMFGINYENIFIIMYWIKIIIILMKLHTKFNWNLKFHNILKINLYNGTKIINIIPMKPYP